MGTGGPLLARSSTMGDPRFDPPAQAGPFERLTWTASLGGRSLLGCPSFSSALGADHLCLSSLTGYQQLGSGCTATVVCVFVELGTELLKYPLVSRSPVGKLKT